MSRPKHHIVNVARREDLPRWRIVGSLFDPHDWWVLIDGGWVLVRAPSYEEAVAFCVGLYGSACAK